MAWCAGCWYQTGVAWCAGCRSGGRLPFKSIDQVSHVFLQKDVDVFEGIFIGGGIEVEGAAEEMAGRVGDEELCSCCRIAAYFKENAADAVWGSDDGILDGAGFVGMFEGHLIGVVLKFIKGVWSYLFVADVDTGAKPGKVDIDPVGIFGNGVEIAAIPDNAGINRVFEGIGKLRAVEGLVLMRGEIDLKIASSFWGIDPIAGKESKKSQEQQ